MQTVIWCDFLTLVWSAAPSRHSLPIQACQVESCRVRGPLAYTRSAYCHFNRRTTMIVQSPPHHVANVSSSRQPNLNKPRGVIVPLYKGPGHLSAKMVFLLYSPSCSCYATSLISTFAIFYVLFHTNTFLKWSLA